MQDELDNGKNIDDSFGSPAPSNDHDVHELVTDTSACNKNEFTLKTKEGRRYSPLHSKIILHLAC